MGNGETKTAPREAGAGEGRVRMLAGRYGMNRCRPDEPNVYARRLEHPVIVQYPLADGGDPALDERGYREVRDDPDLEARADRECEWWEVQEA